MTKKRTRNFGDAIRAELAADPELAKAVEDESFNANIAQQVYDLRNQAGITQKQLAELVHTQQSVISRIEDANYDGHSLAMLRRIAHALNRCLKVEFAARQVFSESEVTEFPLTWSIQGQWQTKIELAETLPLDLSGAQVPVSRPATMGLHDLLFSGPQKKSGLVKA